MFTLNSYMLKKSKRKKKLKKYKSCGIFNNIKAGAKDVVKIITL